MGTAELSTIRVTKPLAAAIQKQAAKGNARPQDVALEALERGLATDEFRAHIRAAVSDEVAPLRALIDALLGSIRDAIHPADRADKAPIVVPDFVRQWDEWKSKQPAGEEKS